MTEIVKIDPKVKAKDNKTYYTKHRDKILECYKSKIYCAACDKHIGRTCKAKHERTKKHIRNLQAILERIKTIKGSTHQELPL